MERESSRIGRRGGTVLKTTCWRIDLGLKKSFVKDNGLALCVRVCIALGDCDGSKGSKYESMRPRRNVSRIKLFWVPETGANNAKGVE